MPQIKIFYLAAFFIAFIIFTTNTFSQYDLELKKEIKASAAIKSAKVRSVTQVQYTYSGGKQNTEGQPVLYNEFDSTGKCIHWIRFWADGSKIEETNQYTFDDKGHLTTLVLKGMDGNIDTRTENTFDPAGNEIESDKYSIGGTLVSTWTHKYDSKGREIEQVITKGSDPLPRRKVFKYDDARNIIETDFFRQDTLTYKYITVYNNQGNPVEEDQFTPDNEHTRHTAYSYDEYGNQTEVKISLGDGKLISISKYKYDKFSNLLEETRYDSKEAPQSVIKYNYEYIK